ncbi:unnamed protein product [Rhodiola kirilowii]
MALGIKMKFCFVRGKFPKPTDVYQAARWDKCNNVVLSWIINSVSPEIGSSLIHAANCMQAWEDLEERFSGSNDFGVFSTQQDIAMLMQEEKSIAQYYNKLIQLWGDEDALTEETSCDLGLNCKATKCSHERKMIDRRMKFLMGLNEEYFTTRSNILQMRPSPSLKECYKQLVQAKNQRKSKKTSITEMSALYVNHNSHSGQSNGQSQHHQSPAQFSGSSGSQNRIQSGRYSSQNTNKKSLFCTHCQLQGHLKETCYKLHGYPLGYKFTNNRTGDSNNRGNTRAAANNVIAESSAGKQDKDSTATDSPAVQLGSLQISQVQLNKLMAFLGDSGAHPTDHIGGITCLSSVTVSQGTWVIDSGATDHITPHAHLFSNITSLQVPTSVLLPNGKRVFVTHTGDCQLNKCIKLTGVLLVPHIRFNLLSVAKLVEDVKLKVTFTKKGCSIQDQANQILQGTGDLIEGLYHFKSVDSSTCLAVDKGLTLATLWDHRLGHVPFNKLSCTLKHLVPDFSCKEPHLHCSVCPQVRQTRLSFPISTSISHCLFDLIHVDIWGPYKVSHISGAKYFLTIVEDKSRVTWTYLMKAKSEVAGHLINFYLMVKLSLAVLSRL